MKKRINRRNYTIEEALRALSNTHKKICYKKVESYISPDKHTLTLNLSGPSYTAKLLNLWSISIYLDFGVMDEEPGQDFDYLVEYAEKFLRHYTGKNLELVIEMEILEKGGK